MAVNVTNLTDVSGFAQFAKVIDAFTNHLFFTLVVFAIFVVLVINLRRNGIERAVAMASLACLALSAILLYMNLTNILFTVLYLIMCVGSLFMIRFGSE